MNTTQPFSLALNIEPMQKFGSDFHKKRVCAPTRIYVDYKASDEECFLFAFMDCIVRI